MIKDVDVDQGINLQNQQTRNAQKSRSACPPQAAE